MIFLIFSVFVIYMIGVLFFNNAFLPNTYINGVNYGLKSVKETELHIKNNAIPETFTLIKNDGTSEEMDLSSLDYTVENQTDLQEISNSQSPFTWAFAFFSSTSYKADVKITYDVSGLDGIIDNLKCVTSQKVSPPQDAYIEKTENGYKVIPEKEGSLIDKEILKEQLIAAIQNNETELDLSEKGCYKQADVTTESESIRQMANLIENLDSIKITYDFDDRQEVLTSEQINSWILIDENNEIQVDTDKAKQYVINLAAKYDTYMTDREFVTSAGETITVGGGIYGWQTDVAATRDALIEAIKQCQKTTLTPVYKIEGMSRATDDIGDTYVEISLEQQHMWYYKDGELFLETDVVTGLDTEKRQTPTGVFCIWSREKDRYLGEYAVQGYRTHVNYWMPIDWTGVGIHDSSWRTSFGGEIYKTNGSHGCINTPKDKVSLLFENCRTNTPVIIY